ncbi:MAG: hypothetical protein QXH27_01600 [Candidatus Micrarchaeia archaeon]
MDHLRAVGLGVLLWLVLFAMASIVMFSPLGAGWITPVMLVLAPILAAIAAKYYLEEYRERQAWIGFCLGIIWLVVSAVLDYIVTVGVFKAADFYNLGLLAGYLEIILVPTLVGWWLEGKRAGPAARAKALKKKRRR